MASVDVSYADKAKLVIKGSSKFVILAIAAVAFALDVIYGSPNVIVHYGDSAILFVFVIYAIRVMERQRKKFGRLIH